ncbi:MAG TPA: ComEA family DNA-binding protein [Anaerolineales bacterium]|nr:ComEA family DNA-binding protein [Anaerolineales bacterium]
MKNGWAMAFGVVCGLLGAGLLLLVTGQPQGAPVQLSPPPTAPPLVLHVTGAVARPGVYSLPDGSRVADAVQAAGGMLSDADAEPLNLAALVQDGERVWVPWKQAARAPPQSVAGEDQAQGSNLTSPSPPEPIFPVNINTAPQDDLESLPGVGPVIAKRIIAYRQEHGPFTKIDDLQQVDGIGPTTFDKLKDLISVGYSP